jgi:hypothetical protein
VYVRARPDEFAYLRHPTPISGGNSIFISKRVQTPDIAGIGEEHTNIISCNPGAFYLKIEGINAPPTTSKRSIRVEMMGVEPRELWDAHNHVFLTDGLGSLTAFLKLKVSGYEVGVVQVVVACGFSETLSPWVMLKDYSDELFAATTVRDYQRIADIGAKRGNLRTYTQELSDTLQGTIKFQSSTREACGPVRNKDRAIFAHLYFETKVRRPRN